LKRMTKHLDLLGRAQMVFEHARVQCDSLRVLQLDAPHTSSTHGSTADSMGLVSPRILVTVAIGSLIVFSLTPFIGAMQISVDHALRSTTQTSTEGRRRTPAIFFLLTGAGLAHVRWRRIPRLIASAESRWG
jgi:hypothetical protein